MNEKNELDILIPVFNENENIIKTLKNIKSVLNFNYNIAEYLFFLDTNEKVKLKKHPNTIKTVNIKDFKNEYWEFTKKKIIWARKSDRIKNEIDYDNAKLKEMKELSAKVKRDNKSSNEKVAMFDKLNKFDKYDSLTLKNNRRLHK